MNHYATNSYFNKGGRHYWLAENLIKNDYEATVFCANTRHPMKEIVDTKGSKFTVKETEDIPYVFVKTTEYAGNSVSRVKNMVNFARNLGIVAKTYAKKEGKPDVILASSVHPLTLVAGIRIAKKFNVPCICEVRDLWPESIVEFQGANRKSLVIKSLRKGEKWIYKKADRLIFTMEGGVDYITDNKWDKDQGGPIDISKVYHINNGTDLELYRRNIKENPYIDGDLDNPDIFKVVYAGSIRKANNIGLIIDAAKYVGEKYGDEIKFLIFGDGNEKQALQQRCIDENIENVVFKGIVEKRQIPNILSKSNLNILNYASHNIWKYGGSQNKMFEYLASGKPILSTIKMGYDIIEKYKAGISLESQSATSIGDAVIKIKEMDKASYEELSNNSKLAAKDYDFKVLTNKLIDIIEEF